ncbi:MAG: DNA replication/repair protein RecF [Gammaproteobacteria bacterium]
MGLLSLSLREFRCFAVAELEFAPTTNLIIGENASGKTSLLEAIFLLGRGRSFRTPYLGALTRTEASGFQLTGKITSQSVPVIIGLARTNGLLEARIGGQRTESLAQLAQTFPVQLIDSQAHQLIRGGPRQRRQFLDWGVFHVEPAFFPIWRRFQRALQQRNALLRTGRPQREVDSWNGELAAAGQLLDGLRRNYLANFSATAANWAERALGGLKTSLEYQAGWPVGRDLSEALQESTTRDRKAGMTQVGPHRADMAIKVEGRMAQERVSRGQEKVLAGALLLAQASIYRMLTGHSCTLLLDDLAAELDAGHLIRFMEMVAETRAQVHITAIEAPFMVVQQAAQVFHVKQDEITAMV